MKSAIRKCALLSLSEIPYSWRSGANRVMLLRDDPTAQIALWCAHWTVPVQRAGSGDLGSSPADQRAQAQVAKETSPQQRRSSVIRLAVSAGYDNACGIGGGQPGNSDPLAPRRLPSLLALPIKASRWPAEDVTRDPTAHSRHEHREPAMGRTTDPRRTSQARHRCRANDCSQIYGNYQKPHPGLKRDEQHVGHLETHAHPA